MVFSNLQQGYIVQTKTLAYHSLIRILLVQAFHQVSTVRHILLAVRSLLFFNFFFIFYFYF